MMESTYWKMYKAQVQFMKSTYNNIYAMEKQESMLKV